MNDRLMKLQVALKFSSDHEAVVANAKLIAAELMHARDQVKIIEAFAKANQAMCKHEAKKTYNDPRDSYSWSCSTCGAGS